MPRKLHGSITPAQLGALAGYGMVEIETDSRRNVRLGMAASENTVVNRVATDDDGNEYTVLVFPEKVWPDVCATVGIDESKDRVKIGGMIWMKADQ